MARSIRLKERAGDQHQIAVAHSNMAEVELRLNHPREALDHAKRAVQIGEKAGARSDLADMYKNVANASLALGDMESAFKAGERAVTLAASTGRVYLADTMATLERVAARAEATDATRWHEANAAARATIAKNRVEK
jgi:tetratricopeptide (TPR) repeat protein